MNLKHLAYTFNLWLKSTKVGDNTEAFKTVFKDQGYDPQIISLLSLTANWTNDIGKWIDDVFGIETTTYNINTWKINGQVFEAFSDEYYAYHDKLIETNMNLAEGKSVKLSGGMTNVELLKVAQQVCREVGGSGVATIGFASPECEISVVK